MLGAFLAQFYDDKPCPPSILLSHDIPERELLAEALSTKTGRRVEVSVPQRGEKKELVAHALVNAREALGRKLADTSSQQRLLKALAGTFGLPRVPRRIEVYDNSHIQGSNAVGAMIVAGPGGLSEEPVSQVQHPLRRTDAGRRLRHDARGAGAPLQAADRRTPRTETPRAEPVAADTATALLGIAPADNDDGDGESNSPWPDLVLIDGGQGQLNAARETLAAVGVTDVPMIGVAKGPDRDAGNETFYLTDKPAVKLPPRDPLLYFIQRLRDEAHRFAIGSHRTRRKKDIREAGLQEIPGIGPTRKRALLHHFGTLKAIERASLGDLAQVPGINEETARKIHDFFHETASR